MKLVGKVTPERPLLVMAVKEEGQCYDGDLPRLFTGLGKINSAAALAAVLARGPSPSGVINLGTAGALRPGWTGTHVIGRVIQHDFDSELLRRLTGESWGEPLMLADREGPVLATGDVFVSDSGVRARLAAKAALVDMEGYAVVAVANQAGIPIRVVKHVSDNADAGAVKAWRETIADSAAALAKWVRVNVSL